MPPIALANGLTFTLHHLKLRELMHVLAAVKVQRRIFPRPRYILAEIPKIAVLLELLLIFPAQ